jgi:hypothetical protein
VYLPLDLQLLINQDCAKDPDYQLHQKSATFILRLLTEHYKTRLPKEIYEKFREEYSMTAIEQKERNRLKHEESTQKKDPLAKEERKVREEIALCNLRLKEKPENPDYWKDRLETAKERLEIIRELEKEK